MHYVFAKVKSEIKCVLISKTIQYFKIDLYCFNDNHTNKFVVVFFIQYKKQGESSAIPYKIC